MKKKLLMLAMALLLAMPFVVSEAQAEGELPVINRVFGLDESLKITGEVRHRFEFRDNWNWNANVNDEDAFHLIRTRINVNWNPDPMWHFFAMLQDARSIDRDGPRTGLFNDENFDIHQLYVDVKDLADGNLTIRAGRQQLNYGDQRLVGGLNWTNTARSFDAVKLMYTTGDWDIDAWWARVVQIDPGPWPNEFNSDDDFFGVYSTYHGFDKNTVQAYYFYRDTKNKPYGAIVGTADQEEHTIGGRANGKKLFESDWGSWDYTIESAYQFGDFGTGDIDAYMLAYIIGYQFNHDLKPYLSFEYAHGSGDNNSADNDRNTFDNLFPTNHKFYGYMDRFGLQNITTLHGRFSVQPTNKIKLWLDYHYFVADELSDSTYSVAGGTVRTPAVGASVDSHIGEEIDLTMSYKWNKYLSFLVGYGHFFAGEYLADTGGSDDGDFFFTQTSLKF